MNTRTDRETLTFKHPFCLKGIDRTLPAGAYQVITDEQLIEGLSFLAYRRLSTMMVVPGKQASSIEMVTIDPLDLQAALDQDACYDGQAGRSRQAPRNGCAEGN